MFVLYRLKQLQILHLSNNRTNSNQFEFVQQIIATKFCPSDNDFHLSYEAICCTVCISLDNGCLKTSETISGREVTKLLNREWGKEN